MKKNRTNYTPEQKVTILKKHLVDHVPVSDICDLYDLHPTVFYRWQKEFVTVQLKKKIKGRHFFHGMVFRKKWKFLMEIQYPLFWHVAFAQRFHFSI